MRTQEFVRKQIIKKNKQQQQKRKMDVRNGKFELGSRKSVKGLPPLSVKPWAACAMIIGVTFTV